MIRQPAEIVKETRRLRDRRREALPSKVTNVMLRKGDIVRLETSGGGRFGERKRIIDLAIEHRLATTMQ
jgi:N-methylhydantoinase B/oxoprolinase/acetone carboxylase alpha subunit